jgi:hypothetical protein
MTLEGTITAWLAGAGGFVGLVYIVSSLYRGWQERKQREALEAIRSEIIEQTKLLHRIDARGGRRI